MNNKKNSVATKSPNKLAKQRYDPNVHHQNDLTQQVTELCHSSAQKALWLVLNEFPVKIKQIEMLKEEFRWKQILSLHTETKWIRSFVDTFSSDCKGRTEASSGSSSNSGDVRSCIQSTLTKPFIFDAYAGFLCQNSSTSTTAMIDTNNTVHQMIDRLKPFLVELLNLTLKISFGVQILEPKLQEGNNFGVEVQSKAVNSVIEIFNSNLSFYQSLNMYYRQRESILQYMMLYPHIEDYQVSLAELDKSYHYSLCRGVAQLYSSYTALHDFVVKNIEKLLRPRDEES